MIESGSRLRSRGLLSVPQSEQAAVHVYVGIIERVFGPLTIPSMPRLFMSCPFDEYATRSG
jgi:hypothetical protein